MLTVIVAGRNDDYGKDFRERLFRTALHNSAMLAGNGIEFEYLLAEWNPLPDRPPLSEEFVDRVPNARAVIIPAEIHRTYSLNPQMPFHEMPAKNAAIRRARGDVIIVTNADILFSEGLVRRIAAGGWRANTLYRAHRIDVSPELGWDDIQNPANQLASGEGTEVPPYYLGAGGDFCLATRRVWHFLGGFNERIRFSTRAKDWQFFLSAAAQGVEITFIGNVYHLNHEGGFLNTSPAERNADAVHFGRWWDIEFGLPVRNASHWGFARSAEIAYTKAPRVAVLQPNNDRMVEEDWMPWLTRPVDAKETAAALLLHAICAAYRERRKLICRIRDPRLAVTLSGFDSIASQFGVQIHCDWKWPELEGYSVQPFDPEPAHRESDWIFEEGGIREAGSGREVDVLPKTIAVTEPDFNPVLVRRVLRAYLRLQEKGIHRIAIYGGGSHTQNLLQWGVPDSIELLCIVESNEREISPPSRRGTSDLPGRADSGVAQPLSDRRVRPSSKEGNKPAIPYFGLSDFAATAPKDIALLLSSASFESDMLKACRDHGISNVIPLYTDWPQAVSKVYA